MSDIPERIWIAPSTRVHYGGDLGSAYEAWDNANDMGKDDTIPYRRESDVADLERRLSKAVELIAKLRAGVERYSSDLCREADEFMEEV